MTANKPQRKKICKTVRLEGSPILQRFCKAQSNFNASARYIILDYIRRHGGQVFDVAQHVQSAYDNVLAGVAGAEDLEEAKLFMPMPQPAEETPAEEPAEEPAQPSFPKKVLPKKKEEEPAETDDDEIPACYR